MAVMEGHNRIFWTLSAIIFMTVSTVHSVCDVTAAQGCIDTQTQPPSSAECDTALSTLLSTVTCVESQTKDCTAEASATVKANLQTKQTAINTLCGDSTCPRLGEQWPSYQLCSILHNLQALMNTIKVEWNKPFRVVLSNTSICREMAAINTCLRDSSVDCERLRRDMGMLYVDNPSLKQTQDICGLETFPTSSRGPIISECARNVDTVVAELQADCPFEFDYRQTGYGVIVSACVEMQAQINCVLQQQATCPLAVTKYLKPRMEAYGIANSLFCGNVTLNGLYIRPIAFPGIACGYVNVMSCFNVLYSIFGRSEEINAQNLLHIFHWNVFNNTMYCDGFAFYNATSTQLCIQPNIEYCTLPFPTYGIITIDHPEEFDLELYNILSPGPIPLNRFGAKFIADRRNFICYGGCENRESLSTSLTNTCKPDLLTKAAAVVANAADGTPTCSEFVAIIECAANASISCPLLSRPVLDIFETAEVIQALQECNTSEPVLLPSNYHPTRPMMFPTTKIPYSTTSYVPPRTNPFPGANTFTRLNGTKPSFSSTIPTVHGLCVVTSAQRCIDRQTLPSSSAECEAAMSTLRSTVICVELLTEDCTVEESATVKANLQTKQTAINAQCEEISLTTMTTPTPRAHTSTSQLDAELHPSSTSIPRVSTMALLSIVFATFHF